MLGIKNEETYRDGRPHEEETREDSQSVLSLGFLEMEE